MIRIDRLTILVASLICCAFAYAGEGAKVISYYGYDDCIELCNDRVTVVLCPAAGGRVLEYSLEGKNVLYLPAGNEGWRLGPDSQRGRMDAGRFDIGPEKVVRRGKVLWMGPWKGEVTGNRSARLTSEFDPESGARLIRDFQLHEKTSQLRCTQTIVNESKQPISLCHWSRTFAVGGGIAVVPRTPRGRFPQGYVMYEGGKVLINPEDPNIQVSDEAVIVSAAPAQPKLGFDSHSGWLAYLAPTNQMFVKRFRTYPDRAYNEFAALTISVWYPQGEMVELEPIGPAENLAAGEQASFSEEWWLLPQEFPQDSKPLDFAAMKKRVLRETTPPGQQPGSVVSPEVHTDRSVTFRFVGKDAKHVKLNLGDETLPLEQDVDGVWKYRSQPLEAGIHDYTFEVAGVRVTDPRNRWLKKWLVCASMVEVPADTSLLTEQQDVPHGTVHRHLYASETTGRTVVQDQNQTGRTMVQDQNQTGRTVVQDQNQTGRTMVQDQNQTGRTVVQDQKETSTQRAAIVYTPPGYDVKRQAAYPVVVLCHGFGDDETAWTEVGRAHHIVDNLIAAGKIEPMVIVMPNGHPVPLAERTWSEDYGARNSEAMIGDVVNDLLPLVQQQYNVATDAQNRAIVGLSMGGGHAIVGGMSHPEIFASVGAFSAAAPQGSLAKDHPNLIQNIKAANADRKLFWIACGTSDFLVDRNRAFNDQLNEHGIKHTYVETKGAHNWNVWRDYLPTFLQLLFRE